MGARLKIRQGDITRQLPTLDFPRHFAWLAGAGLLILGVRAVLDVPVPFAFYGALHAATLVIALSRSPPLARAAAFVILAAASCEVNYLGAVALRSAFMSQGSAGGYALVGVTAGLGALVYAAICRFFWAPRLRWSAIPCIGLLCVAAGLFAVVTARRTPMLGVWWVVMLWWFTFSGGLAWADGEKKALP